MPFFPDSTYGLAYLAALLLCAVVTWAGPNTGARRILAVMVANWFCVRSLGALDAGVLAGIVLSGVTTIALALCWKAGAAKACAVLFALILIIDNLTLAGVLDASAAGAGAYLLGYIILIIMAVASHVRTQGRMAPDGRTSGFGLGRVSHPLGHGGKAIGRDPLP